MVKEVSYYYFDSDVESFNSFVISNLSDIFKLSKKEITKSIKTNSLNCLFDNILLIKKNDDAYEVEISKPAIDEKFYTFKINKLPKEIHIRYGCELETCFIMDCNKKSDEESNSNKKSWNEKIIEYLNLNIIPYLKKEFLNKFRYAFIKGYHAEKGFYIDMKTGKSSVTRLTDTNEYETLVFSPDSSIKCDKDSNAVPCEIVSPVLSSINDIKILYEGLMTESCHQANSSMGFHVSVSAVDENEKMIKLTNGMMSELIQNWLPYESDNYRKLRGEGSEYAQKIGDLITNREIIPILVNSLVRTINDENIDNLDYYNPYGLNLWYAKYLVNNQKYLSMTHHKQNNVIEFRIFPAKNNIKQLLEYNKDAINVFEYSLNNYIHNTQEIVDKLQLTYSKYKNINYELPSRFSISMDTLFNDLDELSDWKFIYDIILFKEVKTLFSTKMVFKDIYAIRPQETWKTYIVSEIDGKPLFYEYDVSFNNDILHYFNKREVSKQEYNYTSKLFRKYLDS